MIVLCLSLSFDLSIILVTRQMSALNIVEQ